jgi:hypothetical protein
LPFKVTEPVAGAPPEKELGLTPTTTTFVVATTKLAEALEPLVLAVSVAFWSAATATVLMTTRALVAPDGTVTLETHEATGLTRLSATMVPPGGAGMLRFTVALV